MATLISEPERPLSSRDRAKELVGRYFTQLTRGCGRSDCDNELCASSKRFKCDGLSYSKDEAGAKALELFRKRSRLCVPGAVKASNGGVSRPPKTAVSTGRDVEASIQVSVEETGGGKSLMAGSILRTGLPKRSISGNKTTHQSADDDGHYLNEQMVLDLLPLTTDTNPNYKQLCSLIYSVFSSPEALNRSFLLANSGDDKRKADTIDVDINAVRRTYRVLLDLEVEQVQNTFLNAMENYSNTLVQYCKQGVSSCLSKLNHCVIVFENPQLHSPEYVEHAFPQFLNAVGQLDDSAEIKLVKWYSRYSADELLEFVRNLQQVITVGLVMMEDKKSVPQLNSAITSAAMAMKYFYLANLCASEEANRCRPHGDYYKAKSLPGLLAPKVSGTRFTLLREKIGVHPCDITEPVIPFDEFINEELNNSINIYHDYEHMRQGSFSFFAHSYLLTPANKVEKLWLDNKISMLQERRRTLLNSLFTGQLLELPFLLLKIDRQSIVSDTLVQLEAVCEMNPEDLRKQLRVQFNGEEGIDEGGVQKEFFQLIVEELFNPEIGMFIYDDSQHHYWFNPNSFESDGQYMLIGLLLGLAIYNNIILDIHFPMVVYRKLVGCQVEFRDLFESHPLIAKSLQELKDYTGDDVEDTFSLTFQISYLDMFGSTLTCELKPDGASIAVTNDNLQEFIDLYTDWLLNKSSELQFKAFKKGFDMVMHDTNLVELFRPEEVELLICGSKDFDFDALESTASYDGGFSSTHPVIINFWDIVHSFTHEQKKQLLQFVTGSDKVPVGGLSKLKLLIVKNGSDSDRLPTAHTCFNALLLCEYLTKEKLEERLLKAITHAKGFGML